MNRKPLGTGTLAWVAVFGLVCFLGSSEARSGSPRGPHGIQTDGVAASCLSTPGTLDPSWAPDGTPPGVLTTAVTWNPYKMAVQKSDGKLVVVGSTGSQWFVARFQPDSAFDTSFGTNGQVFLLGTSSDDRAYDVAIQADGKIVVAGSHYDGVGRFTVVRLNADGTLDTTFGSNGMARFLLGYESISTAVALQPDGKIVVGGFARNRNKPWCFAVAKLTANGALDTTFGAPVSRKNPDLRAGYLIDQTDVKGVGNERTHTGMMAVAPDGKILLGGYHLFTWDGLVARYTADGAVDGSFGSSGRIWVQPVGFEGLVFLRGLAVHGSGSTYQILVSGGASVLDGNTVIDDDAFVASYHADGTRNTGFDQDGFVRLDQFVPVDGRRGGQVIPQPDGKILLGVTDFGTTGLSYLFRLQADGSPDATFGNQGQSVIVPQLGVFPLALDPLGGVYLGGNGDGLLLQIARFFP